MCTINKMKKNDKELTCFLSQFFSLAQKFSFSVHTYAGRKKQKRTILKQMPQFNNIKHIFLFLFGFYFPFRCLCFVCLNDCAFFTPPFLFVCNVSMDVISVFLILENYIVCARMDGVI